jgi:Carbohydrate kinase
VHPLFREVPVHGLSARDRKAFATRAIEVLPLEVAAVFIADAQLGPERSLEFLRRAAEASNTPGRWMALAVEFSSGSERARLALEAARELTATDLHRAQKLYRVALEGSTVEGSTVEGSTVEGSTVEGSTVEGSTDSAVTLEFIAFLAPHQPNEAKSLFELLPESVRTSAQGVVARFQMMVVVVDLSGIIECWRNEFGSSSDLSPDALVHVMQSLLLLDRCDDAVRLADDVLARVDLSPWQRARVLNRKCNAYGQANRSVEALELTNQVLGLLTIHGLPGRDIILRDRALYQTHLGDYRAARTDYEAARSLAQRFQAVVVLKGGPTVVAHPQRSDVPRVHLWVNTSGNPGMASAGMGDVLGGVIAGLMAQGLDAVQAARTGVFLHGRAGDLAALEHGYGLSASDVANAIPKAWLECMGRVKPVPHRFAVNGLVQP